MSARLDWVKMACYASALLAVMLRELTVDDLGTATRWVYINM